MDENGQTQSINIEEFKHLCAGWPSQVQRGINGWLEEMGAARVRELAIRGGGTSTLISPEAVKQLFSLEIIKFDPEKITTSYGQKQLAEFMQKHELTHEDLKLPPPQ